jgi:hypothetical protein
MTTVGVWLAVLTTVMALVAYELSLARQQRREPLRHARSALHHAGNVVHESVTGLHYAPLR